VTEPIVMSAMGGKRTLRRLLIQPSDDDSSICLIALDVTGRKNIAGRTSKHAHASLMSTKASGIAAA